MKVGFTTKTPTTLLDNFIEDWFELVFVEGCRCPRDDPVYPVRLLEAVDGSLVLLSLVVSRPQSDQHCSHQAGLVTVVLHVTSNTKQSTSTDFFGGGILPLFF